MFTEIFDLISFVGAVQGILVAIFLFTRREKHPATRFLTWYILLFSVGLLEPFAVRTLSQPLRVPLLSFLSSSNFLYGPLLYLFVSHLVSAEFPTIKKSLLHFAPFIIVFVGDVWLSADPLKSSVHEIFLFIAFESLIIQILSYNINAIKRLTIANSTTEFRSRSLEIVWLKSLLVFITAIYALSFLISHLIIFGLKSAETFYLVVQLAITIMIYLMTYRLIMRPQLFLVSSSRMGDAHVNRAGKYLRSGLKREQAEEYAQQLNALMETEKPHLDPEVSIYGLSKRLNISRNHLTQIINEKLNRNFYEFINEYRVEEVKKMLQDPAFAHLTLTGIGLEAGFKSKTAFNLNFKKTTGCTPTEWKKAHASDLVRKNV